MINLTISALVEGSLWATRRANATNALSLIFESLFFLKRCLLRCKNQMN